MWCQGQYCDIRTKVLGSATVHGYENIGGYIYAAAVDVITGKIYEYKIACDLGDE